MVNGGLLIAYDAAIICGQIYYELGSGSYDKAKGFFDVASTGLVSIIQEEDPRIVTAGLGMPERFSSKDSVTRPGSIIS